MAAARLDRAVVVQTALRLLNEVGLEGLTLRRIAKELDVQAPALYWHFENKQSLLDEMATAMLRDLQDGSAWPDEDLSWQEWMKTSLRFLRNALLRYRDGAKVFSGTQLTDTGHGAGQEAYLRMMTRAGFAPATAGRAYFIAFTFTIGFVIEEQAVEPEPGERAPEYDPEVRAARMAPDHPLAAQISEELFSGYEARFEEGIDVVVTGIEARMAPGR